MFSAEMANTPSSPIPSTSHDTEGVNKRARIIPLAISDEEEQDDDDDDDEGGFDNYVTDVELQAMTVEAPGKSFVPFFSGLRKSSH